MGPAKALPDLSGMPASDALKAVVDQGFVPRLFGSGRVVRQQPSAGTLLESGAPVQLFLEPPS